MKEIWILNEEYCVRNRYNGLSRSIRAFDSFEKAKEEMAQRISFFANDPKSPFKGLWNILDTVEEALDDEEFLEDGAPDLFERSMEYMKRFFSGEAGKLVVTIEDAIGFSTPCTSFTCGCETAASFSDFFSYITSPHDIGWDYVTADINAFLMEDPEKNYHCFIREATNKNEFPYYLYISLSKLSVE